MLFGTGAMQQEKKKIKHTTTQLLHALKKGDKKAVNELMPLVYDEMRNIAHNKLRFERKGHTIDTTALVHEAYFKLINHDEVEWQSRAHFLAVAALAMKRILINYAKHRKTIKHGGEFKRIELEEIEAHPDKMSESMAEEILALDEALKRMATFNERGSRVVDYYFFGGLTWKEISEVMGISPVTARRSWIASRLWLRRELNTNDVPDIKVNRPEQFF